MSKRRISKIEYIPVADDLTIWFEDSDEPFSPEEFIKHSPVRENLEQLRDFIAYLADNLEVNYNDQETRKRFDEIIDEWRDFWANPTPSYLVFKDEKEDLLNRLMQAVDD